MTEPIWHSVDRPLFFSPLEPFYSAFVDKKWQNELHVCYASCECYSFINVSSELNKAMTLFAVRRLWIVEGRLKGVSVNTNHFTD